MWACFVRDSVTQDYALYKHTVNPYYIYPFTQNICEYLAIDTEEYTCNIQVSNLTIMQYYFPIYLRQ